MTEIAARGYAGEKRDLIKRLHRIEGRLLDEHVNRCVASAFASGDAEIAAEKRRELLDAVERFARTR